MPVERQRWVPVERPEWSLPNQRLQRNIEVLDESDRWHPISLSADTTTQPVWPQTIYLVDTTAGDVDVTLPPARTVLGFSVRVKKMASGHAVHVVAAAGETVDGVGSINWTGHYEARVLIAVESGGTAFWVTG